MRLMANSHIATYPPRYFLCTPPNVLRKLRTVVHNPSMVFTCTSLIPAPASSRAHSFMPCAVLERSLIPFDPLLSAPLVGVERSFARRVVVVDIGHQRSLVGALDDPQPRLSGAPAHAPDYRRALVIIGAVPAALVGASPGRIVVGVRVPITFFPPRCGTSHRSPHAHPLEAAPPPVEAFGRFPVAPCASRVPLRGSPQAPRPTSCSILPCSPLARARPPARGASVSSRRALRSSRGCRCPHTTLGSGKR